MPLRTITIGRHRTLSGLARAVFDLGNSPLTEAEAEAALLRANPHLADASGFVRGDPVVVPDLPGAKVTAEADPARAGIGLAAGPIVDQFDALAAFADKAIDESVKAARENLAAVTDRTLLATVRKFRPDILPRLQEIEVAANADVEALANRTALLRKALAQAGEDLKPLRGDG